MKKLFENFRIWATDVPSAKLINESVAVEAGEAGLDTEAQQAINRQWEQLDHILFGGPQGRDEGLFNDFRSRAEPHHPADLDSRYGMPQSILKRTLQTLMQYKRSHESIAYAAEQVLKVTEIVDEAYLETQRAYAWAGQDQELLDKAKDKVSDKTQAAAMWGGQNYRNATMALLKSGYLENKYGTALEESAGDEGLLTELENDPAGTVTCTEFLQRGNLDEEKSAAWQRKAGKNKEGGLNAKGRKSYEKENPGSDLKAPVSAKQAKKSKGGKSAKRRKSFCARMCGMKKKNTGAKGKRDPDSRINKALRKWDCNC
tara:strand:+ start:1870 stop:2814 length:945 start_codon:yes stop_codon:yes gene_type:complete